MRKLMTERGLATILAALRMWQRRDPLEDLLVENRELLAIATNEGAFERLTSDEIDRLCDWLNSQPVRSRRGGDLT